MNNTTAIKIELQVSAQKVIHAFMQNNAEIEDQLRNALEKAVKNFDFEEEVMSIVSHELAEATRRAMEYSKIKEYVQQKADAIFEKIIENEISFLKEKYGKDKS